VSQVPLASSSLTVDDVYILDAGLELYVFNGKEANRQEKSKGLEFVRKINNEERGGRANVTFIDEEPKNAAFWSTLGGYTEVTRSGSSDEAHERIAKQSTVVLHVSDSSSDLKVENVTPSSGVLTKDILKPEDVFIVDVGSEVFAWVGKDASQGERRNAVAVATNYLKQNNRSLHTPITRVVHGGEPPVFTSLFKAWTTPKALDFSRQQSQGVAITSQKTLDVGSLLASSRSEEDIGVDPKHEGKHEVKIWRIENMAKVEVPEAQYGNFYGGDSYVILHVVKPPSGKQSEVIYFWQGRSSTTDEKGAAALLAKELDDQLGGSPVQVRVVQGKEPAHFRALFHGKMIVHTGGKASGFTNRDDTDSYDTDGVSLFHVKGTNPENTVASQVDEVASSLSSGDCFILTTPDAVYEWEGAGSSNAEREVTSSIAAILKKNRSSVIVKEGEEPEEFWQFLGGKGEYAKTKSAQELPHEPRLFHCSNAYGYFDAHEIFDFAQDDLNVDDVFLLDTYTSLYVWIGTGANESEKREAEALADKYLQLAKSDGREDGTPVVTVHCNHEPPMFTSNFLAWDSELFSRNEFVDPYEARLKKLKEEKAKKAPKDAPGTFSSENLRAPAAKLTPTPAAPVKTVASPPPAPTPAPAKKSTGGSSQTYSYNDLVAGVDGIDITAKEVRAADVSAAPQACCCCLS
jgi:advillin